MVVHPNQNPIYLRVCPAHTHCSTIVRQNVTYYYIVYSNSCPYSYSCSTYYDSGTTWYYVIDSSKTGTGTGTPGTPAAVKGGLGCTDRVACLSQATDTGFAHAAGVAGLGNVFNQETGSVGGASSVGDDTKDTDLQRSDLQQQALNEGAQTLTSQFLMNFDSALQFTRLAQQVKQMTVQGQMSLEDRDAVTRSALAIANISPNEVNVAIASTIRDGDKQAMDRLMEKAAKNLGMPSSASVRDQLLPALGIQF